MADINVIVTSDLTSSERRISPGLTLSQLKSKLETITGVPPSAQCLVLYSPNGDNSVDLSTRPETDTVESAGVRSQYRIHVEDTRPKDQQLNLNDPNVERYEMPPEEYESREDSVLAWKRRNKLGRFDPNAQADLEEDARKSREAANQKGIQPGARCQVNALKLGTVRYVGPVPEIKGAQRIWVGVEYDEPVGKHDGVIAGTRYFQARPNTGAFVKPEVVEVGDFPEETFDDDDEL